MLLTADARDDILAVQDLSLDSVPSIANACRRRGQRDVHDGQVRLLPVRFTCRRLLRRSVQGSASQPNGRMLGLLREILPFRWHIDE